MTSFMSLLLDMLPEMMKEWGRLGSAVTETEGRLVVTVTASSLESLAVIWYANSTPGVISTAEAENI